MQRIAWMCLLAMGLVSTLVLIVFPTAASPPNQRTVIVHNAYYAKPGMEDDVYRVRLEASAVRARLGLVEGRVLRRVDGPEGGPSVIWEAEYAGEAAREADVAELSKSAEFELIQERMGTLLERFERSVWEVESSGPRSGE